MNDRISLSILDLQEKYGDKGAIDEAARMGLVNVDFDLVSHSYVNEGDVYSLGKDAVREYYSGVFEYAKGKGVKIVQTHGRLIGYGITPERDEVFVKDAELDCIATEALGAKYSVFHTPAHNHVGDLPAERMLEIGVSLFSIVLPFAKEHGIKIAAETHGTASKYNKMEFFGIPENLKELVRRVRESSPAGDALCVCVDTGHTNLATNMGYPTVGDVIRDLGDLVEVLHMHDNNGIKDQHKILGTGIIDWKDVLAALREIGFSGYYNLETMLKHYGDGFEIEEAEFSIKVLNHMLKSR
jgi:sugar phosphate isomerase/epimerase